MSVDIDAGGIQPSIMSKPYDQGHAWGSQAPVPKYYQVKQRMLDRISSGEWEAGSEIPAEQVLEEEYQVSRGTLRRAIDELVRLGLLKRSQGKSTMVSQPRIPIFSKGFRADIQNAGKSAASKIIEYGPMFAPPEIGRVLQLDDSSVVFKLVRVITADDELSFWKPSISVRKSGGRLLLLTYSKRYCWI